jgi:hypothetical protein
MSHVFLYQGLFNDKLLRVSGSTWRMNHIPPLLEEPFVTNLDDYRPKMLVQLEAYVTKGITKEVLNSWEELTKQVYLEDDFGKLDKKKMDMDELVETKIVNRLAEPKEKIQKIYTYVSENIKWNGKRRIFSDHVLDKIVANREGSSAEVNLVMTRMLRQAGIEANPILLSTRKHGAVIKAYPLLVQFNTLACYAEVDGKTYLLDATDPNRPYNLPDPSLLNAEGWLMDKDNPRWVDISRNYHAGEHSIAWLRLEENGNLTGNISTVFSGYNAVNKREMLKEVEESMFWEKQYQKHMTEGKMSNKKILKKEDISTSLTAKADIETSDFSNVVGEFIYIKPMLMFGVDENPFKADSRYYPVDFVHRHRAQFDININIPEEYEIESIPKSAQLVSQGRGMMFIYQCETLNNSIQVKTLFQINQPIYNSEEYPVIKKMFDEMVARYSDQIVLKKRS